MPRQTKIILEDDARENELSLITHRLPWLAVGLFGGIFATLIASKFETLLQSKVELAFFIPVIVYMADALGTQTETIFIRNITGKKINFSAYLVKELILGIFIGSLFGLTFGLFAYIFLKSWEISLTLMLAMALTMATAPVVALLVSAGLYKEHTDPALGGGPFTTIIQDLLSLVIYFSIASLIILK